MSGKEVAKKQAVVLTERIQPELMTCGDVVGTGRYPYTGSLGILTAEDREKVRSALEMVHALDLMEQGFYRDQRWTAAEDPVSPGDLSGTGTDYSG